MNINISRTKLEHSNYILYEVITALYIAYANSYFSIIRFLINYKINIEKINKSSAISLIAIIRINDLLVIYLLLNTNTNINYIVNLILLSKAIEIDKLKIIEELLIVEAIISDPFIKENILIRVYRSR